MEKEAKIDMNGVKEAVEALLTSSDTFAVGMRGIKKLVDLNSYYNYEHYKRIETFSNDLDSLIQNFLSDIDDMVEERKEAEEAEEEQRKEDGFIEKYLPPEHICSVCGNDKSEHNWEVHVAEMRASVYPNG